MDSERVTIIAEMANAHEGDLSRAREIVTAVSTPADAVKFQVFSADELVLRSHPDYSTFRDLEMTRTEWDELVTHARDQGLQVFTDVFGHESVDLMADLGVDAFKIHSSDISNHSLLDHVAERASEVILSAGGSTWVELADALNRLTDTDPILVYGYQNYPTALENSNLGRMQALAERFDVPVGYAPHVAGDSDFAVELPRLAVAAGASAVEVHVTLDRSAGGTDHYSSLEPGEFEEMVELVQLTEEIVGSRSLELTAGEREYRNEHKKWLVATEDIGPGTVFTPERVGYKRLSDPPVGHNLRAESVHGHVATQELSAGEQITLEHMDTTVVATLACRAESRRLYGKPMQLVGDRPILDHLVSRLRQVDRIDDIVLAIAETPSKDVFVEYAESEGLEYVYGSEENVLARLVAAGDHADGDVVVRVTTENPFVYHENVDELIVSHLENNCDLTLTRDLPMGSSVEIVSLDALKSALTHGENRHLSELCTLFIVENPDSFTINVVDPPERLQRPDLRLTVDNPEDLLLARDVWDHLGDDLGDPALAEIVEYLDSNPDISDLNSHLPDGTDDDVESVRPFMYGEAGEQ